MSPRELIESEVERMQKLGYTEEEIIEGINAMLRAQNMVAYAVL